MKTINDPKAAGSGFESPTTHTTLQQELDDLVPAVKAWEKRERALQFVLHAQPYQLEIALIEWVMASHELLVALTDAADSAIFRRQVEALEGLAA